MLATRTVFDDKLWFGLRLMAGGFLLPHGAQKLFGLFGSPGMAALSAMFEKSAGLTPGVPFVYLTGAIELVGGLFLLVGFATRLAAAACSAMLVGAIILVNAKAGFFWMKGGFEYALMWAILCACFAVRGGGAHSVDGAISGNHADKVPSR